MGRKHEIARHSRANHVRDIAARVFALSERMTYEPRTHGAVEALIDDGEQLAAELRSVFR